MRESLLLGQNLAKIQRKAREKCLCGHSTLKWPYSLYTGGGGVPLSRTLQKVIFAKMTFIRPITRKFGFFLRMLAENPVLGQVFQFLQKVIFADLTFIRPITPKFRGGNDFYKTNHSKIHEIRPITPKSDWSYNHPPL